MRAVGVIGSERNSVFLLPQGNEGPDRWSCWVQQTASVVRALVVKRTRRAELRNLRPKGIGDSTVHRYRLAGSPTRDSGESLDSVDEEPKAVGGRW